MNGYATIRNVLIVVHQYASIYFEQRHQSIKDQVKTVADKERVRDEIIMAQQDQQIRILFSQIHFHPTQFRLLAMTNIKRILLFFFFIL